MPNPCLSNCNSNMPQRRLRMFISAVNPSRRTSPLHRRACCSLGLNRLLFSTFIWSSEMSEWCCSFQRTEIRSQHQFYFGKRSGLGPSFKTTINNNSLGSHECMHECVLVPSVCNRDDQDSVLLAVSVEQSTQNTVEEG